MTITSRFSYSAFPNPVKTLYSTFLLLGVSRLPIKISSSHQLLVCIIYHNMHMCMFWNSYTVLCIVMFSDFVNKTVTAIALINETIMQLKSDKER